MSKTVFATVFLAAVAMSAAAADKPKLAGTWNCQSGAGPAQLEFITSDLLSYGGQQRRYSVSAYVIRVIEDGMPADYLYQVNGDNLQIMAPDGSPIGCVRSAMTNPSPQAGAAAKPSPGGQLNHLLRGRMCSYAGSTSSTGSYSSTQKVFFDGNGRFGTGSESSFSTTHRDAGGNDTGTGGGYGAGDGPGGTYEVTAAQVGAPIRIRWASGEDDTAYVHFVVDGRISEVKYGKKVFGAPLCGN